MDSKVNYALVGLFVIVLSVMMIASILWLTTNSEEKVYDVYQAYISESVAGLSEKSSVKYRGVEVGRVRDISLVAERPEEVRLLLDIQRGTPLKQDTRATLSSQGLTGLSYVELTGGSRDSELLEREEGKAYPEIKTSPSLLVRVDSAISALLQNLDNVSGVANSLLDSLNELVTTANTLLSSDENRLAVAHILKDAETVTGAFADHVAEIETSLDNMALTSQYTANASEKIVNLVSRLERSALILERTFATAESTLTTVEHTAQTFSHTAEVASKLMESSQQDISQVTQTFSQVAEGLDDTVDEGRQDLNRFAQQTLPEIASSLRELRELLNALRHFSQEVERKPNLFLFGKSKPAPGPGE